MKIIMIVIAFMGDVPVGSKIFNMPIEKDLAYCEAERIEVAKAGEARGVEIWSACLEVKRDVKPQAKPKHSDPKSEVKS